MLEGPSTTDKRQTRRFIAYPFRHCPMDIHQVEEKGWFFVVGARPAGAENGAVIRYDLGLDKKIAKGRMGLIGGLWRYDYFGIAGDLYRSRRGGAVGPPDPPHFHIVFGGDDDLHIGIEIRIAAAELHMSLRKGDRIIFGRFERRLEPRGPEIAVADVPDITIDTLLVTGRVLTPAGHRDILPFAVARPC